MELKQKSIVRKKCKRYNIPHHAHELTFSCYRGIPLFKKRLFCDYFCHAVENARIKYEFDVWAYVIMPGHVHFLLFPAREDYSISAILKSIKQSVSRKALNWIKINDPNLLLKLRTGQKYESFRFWQDGGGYDRNIFGYESAKNSIHYIHTNPVRKQFVLHPRDWYYSSYLQIYEKKEGPIKVDLRYFPRY